jgi:hypothetical protein
VTFRSLATLPNDSERILDVLLRAFVLLAITLLAMLERHAHADEPAEIAGAFVESSQPEPADERPEQDSLAIEAQLFSTFSAADSGASQFSEFTLPRAELGAMYRFGQFGAELRLEGVRSASPQSSMGIDGNSLLIRVKRGWAFGQFDLAPGHQLYGRIGLIPDAYKELLENDYDLRGLAPTMTERGSFFDTSDLGAMAGWDGFDRRVRVRAEVANGEGRNQIELNEGKNTTLAFSVTPVAFDVHRGPLRMSLHGAARLGSQGAGSALNNRLAAGFTFVGPCPRAGVEFVRAVGYAQRPELVAQGWGFWANSYFATHWIGGALRYDTIRVDADIADSGAHRTTIALYSDLAGSVTSEQVTRPPLGLGFNLIRLFAAMQLDRYGTDAVPLPGSGQAANTNRYMLILQANGYRELR